MEPPEQATVRKDVYRRLIGYLRPYWKQATFAYISVLFASLLNLYIPQVLKGAIDQGVEGQRAGALFAAAGWILGIAVVRGAAAFGQRYYGEWLTHRVAYDLRKPFLQRRRAAALHLSRPLADRRPDESRHQRHY